MRLTKSAAPRTLSAPATPVFQLTAIACAVLAGLCTIGTSADLAYGAPSAPSARIPGQVQQLGQGIDSLFARWNTAESPGAAVVVTDKDKTVIVRCYGLASVEHQIPITPSTRFELASVSKPFTAFAVLLLEKAGRLSLDDDIQLHLPELPDYGSPITVRDLLHHTSGLSDWVRVRGYAGLRRGDQISLDDLLGMVKRQRQLEFEPGTKWSYSNTNYALLAEIVARVTGRPFAEWTRENVFAPLGMHDTSFPPEGASVIPNRASAYYIRDEGPVRSHVEDFEIPGPAHAFSTIADMAKWIGNMRTGRIGGTEIAQGMRTKGVLKNGEEIFYGAGLGMGEYRGVRTAGHSGQTGAFKTELIYCPDIEVGVVVLANVRSISAADKAREVLDLYLGDRLDPIPDQAEGDSEEREEVHFSGLDPSAFDPFLGGYRLDEAPSVLVAVAREGNSLVGVVVGEGMDFFKPIGEAEFENSIQSCRLTFYGADKGRAERVCIWLRGDEKWASRIEGPPTPALVDGCVGLYYSAELGTVYEIARDDDDFAVRNPRFGSRPLQPADTDVLVGGIGVLTFQRDEGGHVLGFDFSEPEDLGQRQIQFVRYEASAAQPIPIKE